MTQEEKSLLLQDLCARLPYGVIVTNNSIQGELLSIEINIPEAGEIVYFRILSDSIAADTVSNIKPYLRPMSSMTEEEAADMFNTMFPNFRILGLEIDRIKNDCIRFAKIDTENNFGHIALFFNKIYSLEQLDWLNKKGFDYRGLIPMGLALEAPEGMYN